MIRCFALVALSCTVTLIAGCEPPAASSTAANAPPGPPAPPASPAAPSLATELVGAANSEEHAVPSAAPAESPAAGASENSIQTAAPAATPAQLPTSTAGASEFISLSAGVAVPQLLPDGTHIGVAFEYSLRGNVKSSSRLLLVVECKAGEIAIPIELNPQGGQYQGFLPLDVRPEHQPFRARIDEVSPKGERARVSNSAQLATSY